MSKRKSSSTNEEDITKKEEEGENVTISTSHGVIDDVSTMMDVEVLTTSTTTTSIIPTSSAEIPPVASIKTSNSVNMEQSNKRILRSAKKTKRSSVDGTDGHEEGLETAPPTESVTEGTTTATTTSTTTTRPVKRSRQQAAEGEEEVLSTSAQRHQPTSVQEIMGSTVINSSFSQNASTATTKGIGRVSLRLPHEQQLLEDNAIISTTTVQLPQQQQLPKQQQQKQQTISGTTTTQTSAQRHRLLVQGTIISDSLPKTNHLIFIIGGILPIFPCVNGIQQIIFSIFNSKGYYDSNNNRDTSTQWLLGLINKDSSMENVLYPLNHYDLFCYHHLRTILMDKITIIYYSLWKKMEMFLPSSQI